MTAPDVFDALTPGMTLMRARRALADAFRSAGLDSPALDARLLMGHALGLDHTALTIGGERRLDDGETRAIAVLAARRLAREPVARILGEKEFWGLKLRLHAATLVPRPDTEILVEAALAALDADGARTRALRIVDLGTGSGALLLALLTELPNALGVGTDISIEALMAARGNARRLGLAARARFVACDYGAALRGGSGAGFDLVVSNPPYIASHEIEGLAPEVQADPRRALDGGPDGLDAYRAIAGQSRHLLAPSGILAVELGIGQAASVGALFAGAGLAPAPTRSDLGGVPRVLSARWDSLGNPLGAAPESP